MFERTRLNWALTQVDTCAVYDWGLSREISKAATAELEADEITQAIIDIKKQRKFSWYEAIAQVCLVRIGDNFKGDWGDADIMPLRLMGLAAMTKHFNGNTARARDTFEELEQLHVHEGRPHKSSAAPAECNASKCPYEEALVYAQQRFDWEDVDVRTIRAHFDEWTLERAYDVLIHVDLAEHFNDHTPWEVNPIFESGAHTLTLQLLSDIEQDMREHKLDLNPLSLMVKQTAAMKTLELFLQFVEAVHQTMDLDWEEEMGSQNAKFFAAKMRKSANIKKLKKQLIIEIKSLSAGP